MMSRRKENINVSVTLMSQEERQMVANFAIKLKNTGQQGNSKSNVWQYFGSFG